MKNRALATLLTTAMLISLLPILSQSSAALDVNHFKRVSLGNTSWTDDTGISDGQVLSGFQTYSVDNANIYAINSSTGEIRYRSYGSSTLNSFSADILNEQCAAIPPNFQPLGVSDSCAFIINSDGYLMYNTPDGDPNYLAGITIAIPANYSPIGIYTNAGEDIVVCINPSRDICQINGDGSYTYGTFPQIPDGYSYAGLGYINNTLFMYAYGSDIPDTTPSITNISPSSGPLTEEASVTITGSGFSNATAVNFGTESALSYTVNSDSEIIAKAPSGTAGVVNVTVTNSVGTSNANESSKFTYNKLSQTITLNNMESSWTFGATPTLYASASSQLPVTFSCLTADTAEIINGNSLTLKKAGTVTIQATQAGNGTYLPAASVSQSFTIEALPPEAVTNVTAVAGDGQATVYFTPPEFDSGALISYTLTSNPGGISSSGTQSPITVTGLTNGTNYTFTVTAINSAGTASATTNAVMCHGDSSISPENANFDKFISSNNNRDIAVTITQNGNALQSVSNASYTLVSGNDYTISGDQCIIKKEYLKTLNYGSAILKFNFSNNNYSSLNINIGDSSPVDLPVTAPGGYVQINGQWQPAGSSVRSTNDAGQSVTTVTLDTRLIDSALNEGGISLITIGAISSDAGICVFSAGSMTSMQLHNTTLEFCSDFANYTLPSNAINLDSITNFFGGNVPLSDISVQLSVSRATESQTESINAAADSNRFTIVGSPVDFTITCTSGDRHTEIDSFSSYVQRTIELPDILPPTFAALAFEADGSFRPVPVTIIQSGGNNLALINSTSNSIYALVHYDASFTDLEGHWAKTYIDSLTSRMVASGYGDGTYRPDSAMTRAEFTALLVKALGIDTSNATNNFKDIKSTEWYCNYVNAAAAYDLVSGYEDGSFHPNANISREQVMTILTKAMKFAGLSTSIDADEQSKTLSAFEDQGSISSYAQTAAAVCIKNGIINGETASNIAPLHKITRAQAAAAIIRLLSKSGLI